MAAHALQRTNIIKRNIEGVETYFCRKGLDGQRPLITDSHVDRYLRLRSSSGLSYADEKFIHSVRCFTADGCVCHDWVTKVRCHHVYSVHIDNGTATDSLLHESLRPSNKDKANKWQGATKKEKGGEVRSKACVLYVNMPVDRLKT